MTKIIFPATVFYVVLILLLAIFGIADPESDTIQFPTLPETPTVDEILDSIPIIGAIAGFFLLMAKFLVFSLLVVGFMLRMISFTLVDVIPTWLNIIIFLPLIIVVIYEIVGRQIRGSS